MMQRAKLRNHTSGDYRVLQPEHVGIVLVGIFQHLTLAVHTKYEVSVLLY